MSIASRMKNYGVAGFGELDAYGQKKKPTKPTRYITADIEILSQQINDTVLYKDAEYIGISHDTLTDQDYVFYEDEILKVLYVNNKGRYNQFFMARAK